MHYWIWLKGKKENDDPIFFSDNILHGIIPQKQIDHTRVEFVRGKLGLCETCGSGGQICHVIEEPTGQKYCPVLFADLVKPAWTAKDPL